METYAHSVFTWALAKHGVKSGRAAGIAGAVGAAMPDVPGFAGTFYFLSKTGEFWVEENLEAIYFTGPFGATGSALHSIVPVGSLLALYWVLGLGPFDRRRILLWFLLGWAGHTVADFLTHVDDLRPLFWPLFDWKWSSPVSHYNPRYHGREFMLISHTSMLAIVVILFVRRLRKRGHKNRGLEKKLRQHTA